jgi:hypothetical protein
MQVTVGASINLRQTTHTSSHGHYAQSDHREGWGVRRRLALVTVECQRHPAGPGRIAVLAPQEVT